MEVPSVGVYVVVGLPRGKWFGYVFPQSQPMGELTDQLRYSEVGEAREPVLDEDVLRLQVPVRNSAPMRVRESIKNRPADRAPPLFPIQRAALSKMLSERFSGPGEHEVAGTGNRVASVLKERNDVRMVERRESGLDLELEALKSPAILLARRGKKLERDRTMDVVAIECSIDLRHPSFAGRTHEHPTLVDDLRWLTPTDRRCAGLRTRFLIGFQIPRRQGEED